MRSAFKMKGMDFGNSPVTKKGDRLPLGPDGNEKTLPTLSIKEQAYENAQNDYNTSNPTQAQLAQAMKDLIKNKDDIPR